VNLNYSSALTPIQYAKSYVQVSTGRKLLYGEIFNKFSDESGIENEAASIKLQVVNFKIAHLNLYFDKSKNL